MSWHNMNASRKSKRELIVKSGKREQEIAVKYLLLVKNVLAVLPTGYGKSLIFTLFLLARENIITRINTDRCRVFIATGLTGLLRLGLLAASLSELFKALLTLETDKSSIDEQIVSQKSSSQTDK
jgi:hypothetical protein